MYFVTSLDVPKPGSNPTRYPSVLDWTLAVAPPIRWVDAVQAVRVLECRTPVTGRLRLDLAAALEQVGNGGNELSPLHLGGVAWMEITHGGLAKS